MDEFTSKVYVLTDERGRITRCEGGYSIGNIRDFTGWTFIDEGTGDRYNLCQSNYFPDGLCTEDGIPRYKLSNGQAVLRSESELAADLAAVPAPAPDPRDEAIAQLMREVAALKGGEIRV
mgnify:FL=1